MNFGRHAGGFTLVELLTALLILSLLALVSYRGLGAVLDAREHLRHEAEKWHGIASFFARFKRDVELASPRAVRSTNGVAPAWRGSSDTALPVRLEFSRFASARGVDTARRLAYALNPNQEIELWLWAGLDIAPHGAPMRYSMLSGVAKFEVDYLTDSLAWVDVWPQSARDRPIPRAVRLRLGLVSGEEIVRIFEAGS
jgi:general secretion pathway protein J